MTVLGTLLKNRRAGETPAAWNLPNLQGPMPMVLRDRLAARPQVVGSGADTPNVRVY